jgi:hypothetical protein
MSHQQACLFRIHATSAIVTIVDGARSHVRDLGENAVEIPKVTIGPRCRVRLVRGCPADPGER